MVTMHGAVVAGPALAGVIVAAWGLQACYLIDAVGMVAAFYGVEGLPEARPDGTAGRGGVRAVRDGLRFIRNSRVLTGALLADLSATLLGAPMALLPAINAAHFGGSAQTLGLLTAAPAVGGVFGSALSGPVGRVSRQGLGMLVSGAVFGACVAGLGLATSLWLAMVLLAVSGGSDVLAAIFRTSIVQVVTPDAYRGRLSAAESVVGAGCPQLGNFRAGAVGSLTTPGIGVVSGGLATIVGAALIGVTLPAFRRYRVRADAAEPEREVVPD
jgi:hypothetical protein